MGCYKKSLLVCHLLNKSFHRLSSFSAVTEVQFSYFPKVPLEHSTRQQVAILSVVAESHNCPCCLAEPWVSAPFLMGHSCGVFHRGASLSSILSLSCFIVGRGSSHTVLRTLSYAWVLDIVLCTRAAFSYSMAWLNKKIWSWLVCIFWTILLTSIFLIKI